MADSGFSGRQIFQVLCGWLFLKSYCKGSQTSFTAIVKQATASKSKRILLLKRVVGIAIFFGLGVPLHVNGFCLFDFRCAFSGAALARYKRANNQKDGYLAGARKPDFRKRQRGSACLVNTGLRVAWQGFLKITLALCQLNRNTLPQVLSVALPSVICGCHRI